MGDIVMNSRFFLGVTVSTIFLFVGCKTQVPEHISIPKQLDVHERNNETDIQSENNPRKNAPLHTQSKEELIIQELLQGVNKYKDRITSKYKDSDYKEEAAKDLINFLRESKEKNMDHPNIVKLIENINKVAGNIYLYIHYMNQINYEYQQLISDEITNVDELIKVSKNLMSIMEEAMSKKHLWTESDLIKLQEIRKFAERTYYSNLCNDTIQNAYDQFEDAKRHDEEVKACETAIGTIDDTLNKKELWSYSERKELRHIRSEFKRNKAITISVFKGLVEKYKKILDKQRIDFVNRMCRQDIKVAQNILKGEKSKWFNWELFDHSRDNVHKLCRALKLLERSMNSNLVSYNLKDKATQVYNNIYRRFSEEKREEFARYQDISSYIDSDGFPNWSVTDFAEEEWYINRHKKNNKFNPEQTENTTTIEGY